MPRHKYVAQRFWNNIEKGRFDGDGRYDIPIIYPEEYIDCKWIGFNYSTACRNREDKGIHFFLDDYQFERIWTDIDRYAQMALSYKAVLSPDFSMYEDWPLAMNIWNHYRKHYVAAYFQSVGVKVIPSICWLGKESFDWCFDGEPVGGCVAVSSVGTQMNKKDKSGFIYGYDAMLERLNPETILFYGAVPDMCRGNIIKINPFQSRFEKKSNGKGW